MAGWTVDGGAPLTAAPDWCMVDTNVTSCVEVNGINTGMAPAVIAAIGPVTGWADSWGAELSCFSTTEFASILSDGALGPEVTLVLESLLTEPGDAIEVFFG